MPRKLLRLAGVHPDRDLWQRFFGSYSNVLDALGTGMADVGGIYCSVDSFGTIVRAGWSGADRVRVLGVSEPIAGDVLARVDRARGAHIEAWFAAVKDGSEASEHRALFYEIFGADGLSGVEQSAYAALAEALEQEVRD
jgi:ABC-type phosphate/phosphonate transport system substrate-binding protein